MCMWHLGTRFSDGFSHAEGMVGLGDLRGLFQPRWFCDSLIPWEQAGKCEEVWVGPTDNPTLKTEPRGCFFVISSKFFRGWEI